MPAPASLDKLSMGQDRKSVDAEFWTGVQRWTVDISEAAAAVTFLFSDPWTTPEGITFIPKEINVDWEWEGDPGRSLIEAFYQTEFNPARFPSGGATMYVRTRNKTFRAREDFSTPAKKLVETDPDKDGFYYRPLRKGSNVLLAPGTIIVINTQALQATLTWNTVLARVGKINASGTPNIAGAAAETLLLRNVIIPTYFLYNSGVTNVPISYELEYEPSGWIDTDPFVEKRRKRIMRVPILHHTDTGGDPPQYVDRADPYGAAVTDVDDALWRNQIKDEEADFDDGDDGSRIMYTTKSFADLNALAFWN